jgi:hypothetical protein
MHLDSQQMKRRVIAGVIIPIVLAVILGCQMATTLTAPTATSLKLRMSITFAEPISSGTSIVDVGFGGNIYAQGATITCNDVSMHFGEGTYSATVPTPAFPGGYTFVYQAKGQSTSVTIPALQPEIISPATGSRVKIPPPAAPTIPISYRINGAIPSDGATVSLMFGATDSKGNATPSDANSLTFDHLPATGDTALDVSHLNSSSGSATSSPLSAGAGAITFIGSWSSTAVTIPSGFGGIAVDYKFATSIPVIWAT